MKIGKDEILKENNFVFILIVFMLHKRVDPVASKRKVPMKKRKMTESHGVLMTSVEVLDQAIPEHCPGHLCYIKKKEEEEEERESRDPAGRLDCHELGDSSKHLIFHECSNVVSSFPLEIGSGSPWATGHTGASTGKFKHPHCPGVLSHLRNHGWGVLIWSEQKVSYSLSRLRGLLVTAPQRAHSRC